MENGRIAIPSDGEGGLDGIRSGHFGHCDAFTLVDVADGKITETTVLPNGGHEQGGCLVPVNFLASHKVDALVVGGIGMRPLVGFNNVGISVYFDGQRANTRPVVEDLIAGKLELIQTNQACGGGGDECH